MSSSPWMKRNKSRKEKAMAPRSETAVCCALALLCCQTLNLILVLIVAWLKCLNIAWYFCQKWASVLFGATRKTEPKKPTFSVAWYFWFSGGPIGFIYQEPNFTQTKKPTRPEPKNRMPSPTCRAAPFVVFFWTNSHSLVYISFLLRFRSCPYHICCMDTRVPTRISTLPPCIPFL